MKGVLFQACIRSLAWICWNMQQAKAGDFNMKLNWTFIWFYLLYHEVRSSTPQREADCFSFLPFVASLYTSCSVTAAAVLSNVSMCSSESAAAWGNLSCRPQQLYSPFVMCFQVFRIQQIVTDLRLRSSCHRKYEGMCLGWTGFNNLLCSMLIVDHYA